jgi:acetolactate synthase-1/3 small subunit
MSRGLQGPGPHDRPHPEGRRNDQGFRIDPEVEAKPETRRAVVSALVEHEPGVLAKVSGLFARRQFNIEELTVGATQNDDYARITLVVEESEPGIDQVTKQLQKLVPVISVTELDGDAIQREIALVKVEGDEPDEVLAVAEMYDADVVDSTGGTVTIELTGSKQKMEAALSTFERFGVREVARAGTVALERGAKETARDTEKTARGKGSTAVNEPGNSHDGI